MPNQERTLYFVLGLIGLLLLVWGTVVFVQSALELAFHAAPPPYMLPPPDPALLQTGPNAPDPASQVQFMVSQAYARARGERWRRVLDSAVLMAAGAGVYYVATRRAAALPLVPWRSWPPRRPSRIGGAGEE